MIKRFKAWMRERRIRRFRARLKEAYPDAAKFIERIAWLDGTDEYLLNCSLTTAGNLGAYCYEGCASPYREGLD
ncbi:hypothetical protein [Paramuribaculum intestinale]|uniref:hypothetical protein n=1 Tax=Paramuribaculum intestinale TaxID=2094151 RepID=UPI000FFE4553|nr:hypothetical protein [Paramuribaculum intestinale]RXE61760.1 hypothetical protein ED375_08645 [Muribaculaceae bacterium Isolate-004 (NCI)]